MTKGLAAAAVIVTFSNGRPDGDSVCDTVHAAAADEVVSR